jgi:hypothetical protein
VEIPPVPRLAAEKLLVMPLLPSANIFFHRWPANASTASGIDQKPANRPQVIRVNEARTRYRERFERARSDLVVHVAGIIPGRIVARGSANE